jgi:hypothetical protein
VNDPSDKQHGKYYSWSRRKDTTYHDSAKEAAVAYHKKRKKLIENAKVIVEKMKKGFTEIHDKGKKIKINVKPTADVNLQNSGFFGSAKERTDTAKYAQKTEE